MPDKLTDEQIKKALECCAEKFDYEGNEDTCCSCSLITDDRCTCTLSKQALDLINRLQAENERLKKEFIEQILKNIKRLEISKEIKAEAYKEFAEGILELFPADKPNTVISRVTVKYLLKEMGG